MNAITTLKVLKNKHTFDCFSLIQSYSHLLEDHEIVLFMHLYAKARTNAMIKGRSEGCDYSEFLTNHKLDYEKTEAGIIKLAQLQLISTDVSGDERVVRIEKIASITDLMKNEHFHNRLKEIASPSKYEEMVFIAGDSANSSEEQHELNQQTYVEFYSGVLDLLGSEFTLSSEVIKAIKNNEESMGMSQLQNLAFRSIIRSEGKYHVSADHFDFLISRQLSVNNVPFNLDEHQEFWRSITVYSTEELNKNFVHLFTQHDPLDLYALLTSKERIPDTLCKWIRNVTQEHHFKYPIINALMSFVMCLIGKIPTQYLSKVSQTLKDSYSVNKLGLIKLAKSVIDNDIRTGKNRLNVRMNSSVITKNPKQREKEKLHDNLGCILYSG